MGKKKKKKELPFKREIDESVIHAYCEQHDMKAHFTIELLFITTPFGSWYMNPYDDVIRLYHGNSRRTTAMDKKKNFDSDYHDQHKHFTDIMEALSYIHTHDSHKLKRELKQFKDNNIFGGDKL